jgi:hypothetical protein
MAFTYDLATNAGQVRLALGDTVSAVGVRPDGSNLTDAEVAAFLAAEGDDVDLATARACEALATMWANVVDLTVGPRSERLSQVAQRYGERAAGIRGGSAGMELVGGYVSMGFATTGEE